jgi:hypothetical protein
MADNASARSLTDSNIPLTSFSFIISSPSLDSIKQFTVFVVSEIDGIVSRTTDVIADVSTSLSDADEVDGRTVLSVASGSDGQVEHLSTAFSLTNVSSSTNWPS